MPKKSFSPNLSMIGILIVGVLGLVVYRSIKVIFNNDTFRTKTLVSEDLRRHGPCPGPLETIEMKDPFMPKLLPVGKRFEVLPNWYACHPVESGDLVYLQYSFKLAPVVRKVYGVPGDEFEISKDEIHHGWNISINGKLVEDSEKNPHYFGAIAPPVLSLYTKKNHGTLGPKNYIVFSDVSPGAFDSGNLGLVNVDDFLGKAAITSSK